VLEARYSIDLGLQYADRHSRTRTGMFIDSAKSCAEHVASNGDRDITRRLKSQRVVTLLEGRGAGDPPKPGLNSRPLCGWGFLPASEPRHFPMLKLSGSVSSTLSHFT